MDLIPKLGKQNLVLGILGDLFDISSVHLITDGIIPQLCANARNIFLVLLRNLEYNEQKKAGETMVVAIIGAGAAGMAAALAAAENQNAQVILLERQARVGRKLQATGNGRCNLTNIHAGERGYHGQDATFVNEA